MTTTLNVSTVRDIGVVAARMQWERARDRHDDACSRRDALAHWVLLSAQVNGMNADTAVLVQEWLDCTASADAALDQRRVALAAYTRSINVFAEHVSEQILASAVQS